MQTRTRRVKGGKLGATATLVFILCGIGPGSASACLPGPDDNPPTGTFVGRAISKVRISDSDTHSDSVRYRWTFDILEWSATDGSIMLPNSDESSVWKAPKAPKRIEVATYEERETPGRTIWLSGCRVAPTRSLKFVQAGTYRGTVLMSGDPSKSVPLTYASSLVGPKERNWHIAPTSTAVFTVASLVLIKRRRRRRDEGAAPHTGV
jgi:hypothetical protein